MVIICYFDYFGMDGKFYFFIKIENIINWDIKVLFKYGECYFKIGWENDFKIMMLVEN